MANTSPLRGALNAEIASAKAAGARLTLTDLTVLATKNDPFRVDTGARHRDGEWLATTAADLGLGTRRIHLRGLHYMVLGRPKPDGSPYTNTDKDWEWLQGNAAKAARWLGYLPFGQIVDQRNAEPAVYLHENGDPEPYVTTDFHIDVPDADELLPQVGVYGFEARQAYRIILIGEKSSLGDVLAPVATRYKADLYLPAGEASDTMLYNMARTTAEDGRPAVVLYFSDCDPAGWQMPVSVARKLQAFKACEFPDLAFEVHRVALVPEQVNLYGLPSTPLKESEQRADKWREAMGVDQTEVDALAALRPELLRQIADEAIRPFFDGTLDERVFQARGRWLDEAQRMIDEQIDADIRGRIHAEARRKLDIVRAQMREIQDSMRLDASAFDVPVIDIPQPVLAAPAPAPLVDSRLPFAEQCRQLSDSRAYGLRGGPEQD